MHPTEAFLAELDQEAATTRRVLEHLPESKYDWRPHEKGKSMSELGGHLSSVVNNMPTVLGGESFDVADRPDAEIAPTDRVEMLARWDEAVGATRKWLSDLGDGAFETWRLQRGDDELMSMPRAAAIRSFLFNHLYHHRGQLSAYLRASGEIVPPVYGPTADIDPFAV